MYFRHHTNHPLPAVPSLPGQPVQLLPPSTTTTTTTPAVALEQQQQQRLQGLLQPDLLGGGGRGRSGRRSRGRELFARALAHLARLVGREQLFGLALQPRQRRLAQQPQRPLQEGAPPHPAPPAPAPGLFKKERHLTLLHQHQHHNHFAINLSVSSSNSGGGNSTASGGEASSAAPRDFEQIACY